jgi:IstB-like ATP binding protein
VVGKLSNTLKQHIQSLHLSGLLNSLELRLQEAEANRLPYAQFLELLLQDEINVRHQRMIARRHKWADFREQRSLENFDFAFNPGINRTQVYELAACHFVRQRRDVLLVGPPGVGKAIWSRPSVWKRSRPALLSFIALSSIWCVSCSPRKPRPGSLKEKRCCSAFLRRLLAINDFSNLDMCRNPRSLVSLSGPD